MAITKKKKKIDLLTDTVDNGDVSNTSYAN